MPVALLIIAQEGFQDHELDGTRDALIDASFDIELASTEEGDCMGKYGGEEEAGLALADVDVEDFDKVAFIGGPGAAKLAENPEALRIARETAAAGKPLGAICIAPTILAKAGVLDGIEATVWDSGGQQAAIIEEAGATYTGNPVTKDGKIVTGNGPEAAQEFGRAFAAL